MREVVPPALARLSTTIATQRTTWTAASTSTLTPHSRSSLHEPQAIVEVDDAEWSLPDAVRRPQPPYPPVEVLATPLACISKRHLLTPFYQVVLIVSVLSVSSAGLQL